MLSLQVLKRGTLLLLVRELPGLHNFPSALVKEVSNRIHTWLLPMYGYSAEEELARVPEADLEGEGQLWVVVSKSLCG